MFSMPSGSNSSSILFNSLPMELNLNLLDDLSGKDLSSSLTKLFRGRIAQMHRPARLCIEVMFLGSPANFAFCFESLLVAPVVRLAFVYSGWSLNQNRMLECQPASSWTAAFSSRFWVHLQQLSSTDFAGLWQLERFATLHASFKASAVQLWAFKRHA